MDCKELDRISRSGHSKIFEDEIRSVLKDIDLCIDEAPSFSRFSMYNFVEFANEENFFRIPCSVHDVVLYLWTKFDKRYICLMFHDVGDKELYVHRYYVKDYRNE